jgi:hypothetical protein
LLNRQASPKAFVAWLLYAYSPAGKGIKRPGQFAASRLLKAPREGPGKPYDQIAGITPAQLSARLYEAIQDPISVLSDPVLPRHLEQLMALKQALFGAQNRI